MRGLWRSREAGAATTAIVIAVSVLLLGVAFFYTQRVAKAEDQGSTLQVGADAAALAGAYQTIDNAPGWLADLVNGGALPAGGSGQGAASDFAIRNGGSLVGYHYAASVDRIEVQVKSKGVLESGSREVSVAAARIGKRVAACVLPANPAPTSTSTSQPGEEAAPTKAPSVTGVATCGEVKVPVKVDPDSGKVTITLTDTQIRALFTASLAA